MRQHHPLALQKDLEHAHRSFCGPCGLTVKTPRSALLRFLGFPPVQDLLFTLSFIIRSRFSTLFHAILKGVSCPCRFVPFVRIRFLPDGRCFRVYLPFFPDLSASFRIFPLFSASFRFFPLPLPPDHPPKSLRIVYIFPRKS